MLKSRENLAFVLAGGVGSRLAPLTRDRAKPAVPFGGQYRIIDFTLSNCLHSGLRQVYVLTQYKSNSMHQHLRDAWSIFHKEMNEFITAVPPQQRTGDSWYCGTADAIYQNINLIRRSRAKNVVVLSGDHVYRMDYAGIIRQHNETNADLTVGCLGVGLEEARQFGVMSVDGDSRVHAFHEKPDDPQPMPGSSDQSLASMGIYVFNAEMLCRELQRDHDDRDSTHDFGNDLLPRLIHSHRVYGFHFGAGGNAYRYWRDVGTIDSYFLANMDLLEDRPPLDLHDPRWPIRKYDLPTPPARICRDDFGVSGVVSDSILSNGVIVRGGVVENSVLSPSVKIGSGAIVERCVLLDDVTVGEGTHLRNCIVDKGVVIPGGEIIGANRKQDEARFTVSKNGISVIPKDYDFAAKSNGIESEPVETLILDRQHQRLATIGISANMANRGSSSTRVARRCAR
ncbi:Glucose-1-phosphate adenylyltransferase [Rubripirellula lacrimiformis]|uniref:Glucose-1-phosphate adenylyltransferase n=1 Tax=Rubripirellula lacrimiformis TaxID=1930273 RepID=A0A517N4T0_9BACT|nr:glucose-1-phosphate adenylyltransferase [Rubripirellula lacrimiformis]QDT02140.1 Glucose-1-phosphate adenylyltransferase [Rubripirellula lacrimiformis]